MYIRWWLMFTHAIREIIKNMALEAVIVFPNSTYKVILETFIASS